MEQHLQSSSPASSLQGTAPQQSSSAASFSQGTPPQHSSSSPASFLQGTIPQQSSSNPASFLQGTPPQQSSSLISLSQGTLSHQLQQLLAKLLRHEQHSRPSPILNTAQQQQQQRQQQRSPTTMQDLPQALLVEVLRHVQLQERLGSCSLVSSTWRAAAPAATSGVSIRLDGYSSEDDNADEGWGCAGEAAEKVLASSSSIPCFQQWLDAHGFAAVAHLSVKAAAPDYPNDAVVLQLPFGKLQRLRSLTCCILWLQEQQQHQEQQEEQQHVSLASSSSSTAAANPSSSSSSSTGSSSSSSTSSSNSIGTTAPLQASLCSLTRLTSLRLWHTNYCCSGGLAALSTLTGLRQLQLCYTRQPGQQQRQYGPLQEITYLSLLTQLTRLELDTRLLPAGSSGVFSALQQLQALVLQVNVACSLDVLQDLPPSITRLVLYGYFEEPFSFSTVPAIAQLSALRQLTIFEPAPDSDDWPADDWTGAIDTGFLASMQHVGQLQELCLQGNLCHNTVSSLLSVMPRLTSLEQLRSTSFDCYMDDMPQSMEDLTRYSALLPAAAHLTSFSFTSRQASMLPAGCGAHIFPAGKQLLQLKELQLGPLCAVLADMGGYEHNMYFAGEQHYGIAVPDACFGPGDVARLVRCCPGLERLWIPGLVQPGVDVSALLSLTGLTALYVGGEVWNDDVAVSVLAELKSLQELGVCDAPQLTEQGLLAFAALTRLTKLCLLCCGLGEAMPLYLNGQPATEEDEDEEEGYFIVWAQEHLPAVWLQLLQLLSTHSEVCGQQAQERLAAHEAGVTASRAQEQQQEDSSTVEQAAAAAPSEEPSSPVDASTAAASLNGMPAAAQLQVSEQQPAMYQPGVPGNPAAHAEAAAPGSWWCHNNFRVGALCVLVLLVLWVGLVCMAVHISEKLMRADKAAVVKFCRENRPPWAPLLLPLVALIPAAGVSAWSGTAVAVVMAVIGWWSSFQGSAPPTVFMSRT